MMPQIIVLNAGGQYCHLIARRVRALGVSAEIRDIETPAEQLEKAKGIIVSGGPSSVYKEKSPKADPHIFDLALPTLGICYGHQLIAQALGGKVKRGSTREYGLARLQVKSTTGLFAGLARTEPVWMSHTDTVVEPPDDFTVLGETDDCKVAAMANSTVYGVQFHPEVVHTKCGSRILENFVFKICRCKHDWDPTGAIDRVIQDIRHKAGKNNVFFLISGGVDSTVAFKLCVEALGKDRVVGLYVDTGFMRKHETERLRRIFKDLGLDNVSIRNESKRFFKILEEVYKPEEKRIKIGELFYQLQEEMLRELQTTSRGWLLGQGTIYPDTIETGHGSKAAKIKTHHNRVDLMKKLLDENRLLEPLAEFYKDEVREIGTNLGLPQDIIRKHPFPGPGLAIRCLCSPRSGWVTDDERLNTIATRYNMWSKVASLKTVGVQGDSRTYSKLVLIGGKATIPVLKKISTQITNTIATVNRVAYVVALSFGNPSLLEVKSGFLTEDRVGLLQEADNIVQSFVREHKSNLPDIWQFPVILAPITLGTGESIVLRPVGSKDGMTAEFSEIPISLLRELSHSLLQLKGVDCVLYDVTNKPPATIEWE